METKTDLQIALDSYVERGARLAPSYVISLLALAAGIYPFEVRRD